MMWLGIVVMVIGFIGVLICAKIQRTNPSIQPVAFLCALVMLAGLGIYFWMYMFPPPDRSGEIFRMSVAAKVASELKGQKLTWLASDTTSEYAQKIKAAFEAAGGSAEWVEAGGGDMGMVNPDEFKKIIEGLGADDVVVVDISLMEIGNTFDKLLRNAKGPKYFLTDSASHLMGMRNAAKAFENGTIIGAIIPQDKIDVEFKPDEDELDEAFDARYQVVKKDNYKSFLEQLGLNTGKRK
ncbi:MAG: hypothetical protein J6S43_00055 [Lentisphaeria bacterium]|nr:hypothetical protein [Lentisphaeria bacterium]